MAWTADQLIVSLKEVRKSFGIVKMIDGISFDVMNGEVIYSSARLDRAIRC